MTLVSLNDIAPFDESPETGATFEDNALAKARDAFTATGLPSVADDSGLEVAALGGMPGVLSARWSGNHGDDAGNTALLLAQLRDVPDDRRGAAFVSACALVSAARALRACCRCRMPATAMTAPTMSSSTMTMTAVRPVTLLCGAGAPPCSPWGRGGCGV